MGFNSVSLPSLSHLSLSIYIVRTVEMGSEQSGNIQPMITIAQYVHYNRLDRHELRLSRTLLHGIRGRMRRTYLVGWSFLLVSSYLIQSSRACLWP